MNTVEQAPTYLDHISSIEQLVNEVGPEMDREVDEVGDLLQELQGQLASFRFAADPITLNQPATIIMKVIVAQLKVMQNLLYPKQKPLQL